MKKLFIAVAAAAMLMLGAGAGVVVAQGTANPSPDVMHAPPGDPGTNPSAYAEGITIQEFYVDYGGECNGYGIVTTTRLADRVVQEVVLTEPFVTGVQPGQHCSRAGSASSGWHNVWFPNTN